MSKVASAANLMGVGEDQLAAQLSTIISVTREAPETIGTSLKTIYARINDIQAGMSEDGVSLGNYSGKMAELGINVLDANGKLRDMGEVMEEIGGKWDTLSKEQQVYLAQTMAGQRQYSRLLALFDNWDKYAEALNTAQNAAGTLQQQQDIYMESTEAHLNTLRASLENIYDSFVNTDSINSLVDGLSGAANIAATFIDSIGGGGQLLQDLGAIGVTVFSNQIAKGINTTINNFEIGKQNARQFQQTLSTIQEWRGVPNMDQFTDQLLKNREQLVKLASLMSPEQFKGMEQLLNKTVEAGTALTKLQTEAQKLQKTIDLVSQENLENTIGDPQLQEKITKELENQIQEYKEIITSVEKSQSYFNNENKESDLGFRFTEAKEDLDEYLNKLSELKMADVDQHEAQIEELKNLLNSLPDSADDNLQQVEKQFEDLYNKVRELSLKTGKELENGLQNLTKQWNNPKITKGIENATETTKKNLDNFKISLQSVQRAVNIDKIAQFTGGITQLGTALSQVQNFGSIIADNDLSSMEKFGQAASNLVPTLGMVGYGIKSVGDALNLSIIGPFGAVAAAVTVAIGAFETFNGILKQNQAELIENNKAQIEKENQTQAEIESHKELYLSLEDLDKKYQDHEISRTELKSTIQDLIDQYDLEEKAADNLRNSYDDLASAIKEAREQQAKELVDSTKRERDRAGQNLTEAIKGQDSLINRLKQKDIIAFDVGSSLKDQPEEIKKLLTRKDIGGEIWAGDNSTITFDVDFDNPQAIVEFYDNIQKAVDELHKLRDAGDITQKELNNSEYYKGMTEILKTLSEEYGVYTKSVEQAQSAEEKFSVMNAISSGQVNFSNIENANQYLEQRISLIEELQEKEKVSQSKAEKMADSYLRENFSELYNQYDETASYIDKLKDKLGQTQVNIGELISSLNDQQLSALLNLGTDDFASWDSFLDVLKEISETDFSNITDLKTDIGEMKEAAADNFVFYQSLEDQISQGKGISKATFKQLGERQGGEQLQAYFDVMANGTYQLTGDAEQFYNTINNLKLDGFFNTIDAIEAKIESINQLSEQQFNYQQINKNALGAKGEGYEDAFDYDLLDKQIQYLEAVDGASEEVIIKWKELLESQTMSVEACNEIADAVSEANDQTEGLEEKSAALNEELHDLQMQIHDALVPIDEDVQVGVLGRLADLYSESADAVDGLSDAMKGNQDWALDAAQAILRFDDAIQNLVDNYDVWKSILEQGNDVEFIKIADDLSDAYADLLDLVGDDPLSNSFLRSTENLELFNRAIDGDIDAYNQLMSLAEQDIVANIVINDDSFYDIKSQIEAELASMQGMDDIEIDAILNSDDFKAGLNEMLKVTQATVPEAESLLTAMGFDATVIQTESEIKETPTQSQYWVPAKYAVEPLATGGEEQSGTWNQLKIVEPGHWQTQTGMTSTVIPGTGAVQIDTLHKRVGGDVKFKQASNGGGSAGTARRTAAATASNKEAEKAQKQAERAAQKAQRQAEQAAKKAQREAEQAQKKAQREAEQAAKKAQQQAQKAQKEWEKQNSDTSQKDQKDYLEDDRDIYHNINVQIKQVERNLQRVQKLQDRLYGKELLQNLNKQTAILQKHKKKLEEKLQIQRQDLQNQKDILRSLGATFDQYGNISNYMDVIAQKQSVVNGLISQYNGLVNAYNASTNRTYKQGINNQMEAVNKQLEQAQKELSDAQKRVSDYDSLRESMEDIVDQIDEETQKQIEINITKFRMQLEIRLNLVQAEKDWNKFTREVINHTDIIKDTDFSKIYKDATQSYQDALVYYNIQGDKSSLQTLTEQLQRTKKQFDDINRFGTSAIYGDNKAKAKEDLENDLKELMNQLEDIHQKIDEIDQATLDTLEDMKKNFDEQTDNYQYISGLVEFQMDLVKLLYGEKNYQAMDNYYNDLIQNQTKELEFLRMQKDYWKQVWDQALASGDLKIAEMAQKNYKDLTNSINQVLQQSIKNLKDQYLNSIDQIFDALERKLGNGHIFDYLDMEWDLINKQTDQYLDTINASFAVRELETKFQSAINDTDFKNVKAQKQIRDLMGDQLSYLKSKEKLTQYDVDRAEKLLEIEQARIALEEAQSSKTSMQLKRDAQGNYSYEYVADQQNVSEMQQNLLNAQNELYNFDKDRYKSNLEDMFSAWKEFLAERREIIEDDNLNQQQKIEKIALLEQAYGEIINNLTEENGTIRANLTQSAFNEIAKIYQTDVGNYNQMAEDEKNILMQSLVPQWDSGIQAMADKVAGEGGFIPVCKDAFDDIHDATIEYEEALDDLATTAGYDLKEVQYGVQYLTGDFEELLWNNEDLVGVMDDEIDALKQLRDRAHELTTEYNSIYSAAMAAVSGIQAVLRAEDQKAAAEAARQAAANNSWSSSGSSIDSDYSGGGDGVAMVGDVVTFSGQYYHDSWGRSPAGSKYAGVEGGVMIDDYSSTAYGGRASNTGDFDVHIKSADGRYPDLGWIRLSQLRGFASGGYTGSWAGDEGRLGILHQKELVLNAEDTENILNSVNILRTLMDDVSVGMKTRLNSLKAGSFNPLTNNESLEQNVHIEASFPNVNSKREIEEAFSDLVNLAAQRAMRRR